jgi:hypothetical protein
MGPFYSLLIAVLLVGLHLPGGVIGVTAVVLSLIPAVLLALNADPRYLGSILLYFLPAAAFRQTAPHTLMSLLGVDLLQNVTSFTIIAGVQVDFPLVFCAVASVRVILSVLRTTDGRLRLLSRTVILLWIVALVPAALSSIEGQQLGLNRWSRAIRRMFAVGGLFWGGLLALNEKRRPDEVRDVLLQYIWVGTILYVGDFVREKLQFLLYGVWGAFIPALWKEYKRPVLALFLLLIIFNPAFSYTWTLLGLTFLSGFVGATSMYLRHRALRSLAVKVIAAVAVVSSTLLVILALTYEEEGTLVTDPSFRTVEVGSNRDIGFLEYKLLSDRGPLWRGATKQILEGPYFVVPSGRPVTIRSRIGTRSWDVGVHNAFLEATLHGGMLVGIVITIIFLYAFLCLIRVVSESQFAFLRVGAAGVFATGLVAALTLNMTLSGRHGFLIWMLSGFLYGLHVKWTNRQDDN